MCGLVGLAGDISATDRQVFRDLLEVCQLRGRDSTGVININRQKTYGYIKNVGPPAYLFDRRSYGEIVESGTHAAFIGHCRHKTSGAVNVQNAHPFEYEDEGIIGVHNGTLRNYHNLEGYTYNKVDSDVLYGHLAKHGPEETFNKIDGAWACVWWNDEAETLNFIRNNERPLYFCWSKDRRIMYWASSIWMLLAVETERRVQMWDGPKDDGHGKYIPLPVDTLWSFKLEPNAKKGEATVKMLPAKVIPRKQEPKVHVGNGNTWGSSGGSSADTAVTVWNRKGSKTHKWCFKEGKLLPLMTFEEWETQWKKENGGSVPRPFQTLDDQLPKHLRPKQETLALIQGGKKNTTDSTPSSSEASKSGLTPETPSSTTTIGEIATVSQGPETSTGSPKTNKRKSIAAVQQQPERSGPFNSNPSKVAFRSMVGMSFITDETSGVEWSQAEVDENTGGICSFCDEPIGDLTEIAEFFGKNKFICTHCTEPSVRSVA